MKLYALIMLGGAVGSAARYAMALAIDERTGTLFPWGTIAVNIVGAFLIGIVAGLTAPDGPWASALELRNFLIIGCLGGFTTFSAFSLQTVILLQQGQWLAATGNVLISVLVCLLATMGGMALIARS